MLRTRRAPAARTKLQMTARDIVSRIIERWSADWRDVLVCTVAAEVSWFLAHHIFGHPHPVFAAISAIVCLSPSLPSRAHQAVGMLLGVTVGIVVGEIAIGLGNVHWAILVAFVTFVAMMAAVSFGSTPVIPIQAGISALLVIVLGPATAGTARLGDIAVGAAVGLVFSQVLLTPDPVRMIEAAAHRMLEVFAAGFAETGQALDQSDPHKAQIALEHFLAGHDTLVAVRVGIASARTSMKWSLRGRLAAGEIREAAERYDRQAIRLYASTLLFGESLASALRQRGAPPSWLATRLCCRVAKTCRHLADTAANRNPIELSTPPMPSAVPAHWQVCVECLRAVEDALDAFQQLSKRRSIRSPLPREAILTPTRSPQEQPTHRKRAKVISR